MTAQEEQIEALYERIRVLTEAMQDYADVLGRLVQASEAFSVAYATAQERARALLTKYGVTPDDREAALARAEAAECAVGSARADLMACRDGALVQDLRAELERERNLREAAEHAREEAGLGARYLASRASLASAIRERLKAGHDVGCDPYGLYVCTCDYGLYVCTLAELGDTLADPLDLLVAIRARLQAGRKSVV